MDFSYESLGVNTYLVYEIKNGDEIDTMSLGMMTNNKIAGFVPAFFTQMDARRFVKYNVSGKISLKQFFHGPVSKRSLLGVFGGIVDGFLAAEDYMIDPNTIVLDQDYIFVDVSSCEASLICLPVNAETRGVSNPGLFFKSIMFSTQFDQSENCDHVAKIINYLNSSPVFSPADFRAVLDGIQSAAPAPSVQAQPEEKAAPQPPVRQKHPEAAPQQPAAKPEIPVMPVQTGSRQNAAPVEIPAPAEVKPEPECKAGLFGFLQHHGKENAPKQKPQKATSKEEKNAKQTAKKQPAAKAPSKLGFAIPGQPAPAAKPQANFEIPGMAKTPAPTPAPAPKPEAPVKAAVSEQPPYSAPQNMPAPAPSPVGEIDFGATRYFGDESGEDSGTVILGQANPEQPVTPHLIFKKNNERIPINKPTFRLGRDRGYNDFAIADNKYVGHSHCHIITRDGEFFVVDDNSKNHTYVDGMFVAPGSEVKLSHGQTLKLANEEFEFRLF